MSNGTITDTRTSSSVPVQAGDDVCAGAPAGKREPAVSPQALAQLMLQLANGDVQISDLPPEERDALEQATEATLKDVEVNVGADLQNVLALLQQFAQSMKRAQTQEKVAATQEAVNIDLEAADKAEDAANKRRDAAVTDAECEIAQGAADVGMSAGQGYAGATGNKAGVREQEHVGAAKLEKMSPDEEEEFHYHQDRLIDLQHGDNDMAPDVRHQEIAEHRMEIEKINNKVEQRVADHNTQARDHKNQYDTHKTWENFLMTIGRALDAVTHSSGGMASADTRQHADMDDVDAKREGAQEKGVDMSAEQAGALAASFQSLLEQLIDTRKALMSSNQATNQELIHNV